MNRLIIFFIFLSWCNLTYSQAPPVQSTMDFAGLKLHISAGARKQIQADADALRRYDKYFQKKLQKVDLYFPIIERVFREENLPEDFKYLVIQESALIPDAVSSSNAVGFWQFKKPTALEMGLRVDHAVDERLNIVSSSRAAAKYLKKNNVFFDNWVYALLAYNTGAGGAKKYVEQKYFGKRHIEITKNTHWYVKKFLSHKVAFEQEVGKDEDEPFFLYDYHDTKGKSLASIAKEFEVEEELLFEYNPCFRRKKVPSDQDYPVIIPIGYDKARFMAKQNNEVYKPVKLEKKESDNSFFSFLDQSTHVKPYYSERDEFPKIKKADDSPIYKINGKDGIIAQPGLTFMSMAELGDISLRRFKNYNELTEYDEPKAGQVYYFERKNSKARTHYHTLLPGETLWQVSQKYALKLKKLLSKNRLRDETEVKPGQVLWLRFIRPRDVAPEYRNVDDLFVKKEVATKDNTEQNKAEDSKTKVQHIDKSPDEVTETTVSTNSLPSKEYKKAETEQHTTYEENVEKPNAKSQDINRSRDKASMSIDPEFHYVSKGDTYFNISEKYNIEMSDLLEWNNLSVNDVLSIGQRLIVYPGNKPSQNIKPEDTLAREEDTFKVHTVTGEETLYSIARKYKVTIKDIMEWNDKEDFVIKSGEKLKIYN